jgi:acyl-CoA hydrolase
MPQQLTDSTRAGDGQSSLTAGDSTPASDARAGESQTANRSAPKRVSESATEMVQVVLPNDANPLGYILGGTVMHLIDIAGAIACHRHTRSLVVTAAVDGLQFLHPIKVGDLIILRACVTAAWSTSLEVEVEVFSEETLTGVRRMTSVAYLTFVAIDRESRRLPVPDVILETPEEKRKAAEAEIRRGARLAARKALEARG